MKFLIWFFFISVLVSVVTGLSFELPYSQKLIGFGVLGLFFVVIPLFIYYRWKGKDLRDYMLTNENLDKMKENQNKKTLT